MTTRIVLARQGSGAVGAGDRGLNYGDGVFETIKIHGAAPVWWDAHWARLVRGSDALGIPRPDAGVAYDAARMPFVRGGAIFIPTTKRYSLGDEVFLLLSLLEDKDRLPVAGKVVWITPPGAQGNRAAGIGVQFSDSVEAETVKGKIETLLAGTLDSDKPTHTM